MLFWWYQQEAIRLAYGIYYARTCHGDPGGGRSSGGAFLELAHAKVAQNVAGAVAEERCAWRADIWTLLR